MSGAAVEVELEAARGERTVEGHGRLGARVEHDGGVDVVEDARVDHVNLAARVRYGAFLGGGAEHPDRARQLGDDVVECQPGADGGGADQIVATAVPEPGQTAALFSLVVGSVVFLRRFRLPARTA